MNAIAKAKDNEIIAWPLTRRICRVLNFLKIGRILRKYGDVLDIIPLKLMLML